MKLSLIIAVTCLLALAYASTGASADTCTFDVLVKTGDVKNAGTDSRISLEVSAGTGPTLKIPGLKAWGGKSGHDYFERGNLDSFRGKGPCLPLSPCRMLLTSSGTGNKPGWFVDYVQVTQLAHGRVPPMTHRWDVNRWLAVTSPPRQLTVLKNHCSFAAAAQP